MPRPARWPSSCPEPRACGDLLRWRSERASFRLKLEGLQSNTADDRFRQVDPGFSWEPSAPPPPVTSSLVEPGKEPDVEQYFAEARDSIFTTSLAIEF